MYDVQYDATTYGSKINWIYAFANHKRITCMLNVLILIVFIIRIFLSSLIRSLSLNMCVSSSRSKSFKIQII